MTQVVLLLKRHIFWDLLHGNNPFPIPEGKYEVEEVPHPILPNLMVLALRDPQAVGAPEGAMIGRTKVHFDDYMLVQGIARLEAPSLPTP